MFLTVIRFPALSIDTEEAITGGVVRSSTHAHADKVLQLARVQGLNPGVKYWARAKAVTQAGFGHTSAVSEQGAAVTTSQQEARAREARRRASAYAQAFKLAGRDL